MGSEDFFSLLAILTVASRPESTTGEVFSVASSLSTYLFRQTKTLHFSNKDAIISGFVSGVETASCLIYPRSKVSARKAAATLFATEWAITEPNYASCAQLGGTSGAAIFFYAKNLSSRSSNRPQSTRHITESGARGV